MKAEIALSVELYKYSGFFLVRWSFPDKTYRGQFSSRSFWIEVLGLVCHAMLYPHESKQVRLSVSTVIGRRA